MPPKELPGEPENREARLFERLAEDGDLALKAIDVLLQVNQLPSKGLSRVAMREVRRFVNRYLESLDAVIEAVGEG